MSQQYQKFEDEKKGQQLAHSGVFKIMKNCYIQTNPDHNPLLKSQKSITKSKDAAQINVAEENKDEGEDFLGLGKPAHYQVCVWHVVFKCASAAIFILLPMFFNMPAILYVACILCAAFDFWVVKNITGRILVGLRWWSEQDETGEEKWFFECKTEKENNAVDEKIFWGAQIVFALGWLAILVLNVIFLKLSNIAVILVNLGGLCINTYYFNQCSNVSKKKLNEVEEELKGVGINVAFDLFSKSMKTHL